MVLFFSRVFLDKHISGILELTLDLLVELVWLCLVLHMSIPWQGARRNSATLKKDVAAEARSTGLESCVG